MTAVAFDAAPAGARNTATSGSTGTTLTWDHTFGPGATALLVSVNGFPSDIAAWSTGVGKSYTEFGRSVSIGGVPMDLLEIHNLWSGHVDGWVSVWGLVGASIAAFAGTTQTVVVNEVYALDGSLHYPAIHGDSVSYSGVASYNHTGFTSNFSSGSISIASGVGHMAYSSFGGSRWSTGSGTWRYYFTNLQSGGKYEALLIQDQPGASPTVTASAASVDHGAVAVAIVDLVPFVGSPPIITTSALTEMTAGNAFAQTLAATGGIPITWSVQAGSLPSGLSLDSSSGIISGSPSAAGDYDVTIRASNTDGHYDREYTGSVIPASTFPFDPNSVGKISVLLSGDYYPVKLKIRDSGAWRPVVLRD